MSNFLRCLPFFLTLTPLLTMAAPGLEGDPAMLHVVLRQQGPFIDPSSFAARPKTVYRWGPDRGRVELEADAPRQIQQVVIANGADIWVLNLWDRTGRHTTDHGTTHHFHTRVCAQGNAHQLERTAGYEIGHEVEFLTAHGAKAQPTTLEDRAADLYECKIEGLTLQTYTRPGENRPIESVVTERDRLILRVYYLTYEWVPPNPALFQPPTGVEINMDNE